ncbi:lysophosphatidylcholine acyltransferase isoform X1 [Agrilus planipennis]|uniref:Lysophosphatidylcholine acyltransferase isoform X1 n=1 Tax=Agrilus planipennis TaxID=224129 RepID=A0A1W4XWH6_AGRPL|nr:lysophosphatidylcholine acyltransferase isoform X1 [Agrilus planipennis]
MEKSVMSNPEVILNPFVHHLELESTYEKLKTAFFTVILLPVRITIICLLLITGWLLASVGLWGLAEEDLREKPLTGWRSSVRKFACRLIYCVYKAGGINLKVRGNRCQASEAPIVVLAPHSSFMDSIVMVYMDAPSIVAKGETSCIPIFGKLINFSQPIYVWRDDPDSRHNTIKEIIKRAKSDLDWPQILIFPEGTCTNRSCLITFKPGAFYPGVPVQPVCIRYPNKLDTVTWTWEGPSALKLLWLTLTQVHSYCEIEFLPVYRPNEEEKRDPKLYANNVRRVMAKALGVPTVDYTYDDCRLMARAKEMNLPCASSIAEIRKIRQRLQLIDAHIEEKIINSQLICKDCSRVTLTEFSNYLNVFPSDPLVMQLFKLYDKNASGVIDFREYLLGTVVTSKERSLLEIIQLGFKIYDSSGVGKISLHEFVTILNHTLAVTSEQSEFIFKQIVPDNAIYITFDNFVSFAKECPEFSNIFVTCNSSKNCQKNGNVHENNCVKKNE